MTEPKNSFADYPPCSMEEAAKQDRVVYGPVPLAMFLHAVKMFKSVTIVARPEN